NGAQVCPSYVGAQYPTDVQFIGNVFVEVDHQVVVLLTEVDVPSGIPSHGTGSSFVVPFLLNEGVGIQGNPAFHIQPIGQFVLDKNIAEHPASGIVLIVLINHPIRVVDGAPHKGVDIVPGVEIDRKSTRLNSSHVKISYAVFCLKKK